MLCQGCQWSKIGPLTRNRVYRNLIAIQVPPIVDGSIKEYSDLWLYLSMELGQCLWLYLSRDTLSYARLTNLDMYIY